MFCKVDKFTQGHVLALAILWVFLCNSPPAFLCRDDFDWLSRGSQVQGSLTPQNILLYKKAFSLLIFSVDNACRGGVFVLYLPSTYLH